MSCIKLMPPFEEKKTFYSILLVTRTAPGGSIVLDSADKTAELYKKAVFRDEESPQLIKTQYEVSGGCYEF